MYNYALMIDGKVSGFQSSPSPIDSVNLILLYVDEVPEVTGINDENEPEIVTPKIDAIHHHDSPAIGSSFIDDTFVAPVVEVDVIRHISPDAMRDRFEFEERVLIDSSEKPEVKTFVKDLSLRKRLVNLDSPRFAMAMQLLEVENLLIAKEGQTVDERIAELLRDGTPDEAV